MGKSQTATNAYSEFKVERGQDMRGKEVLRKNRQASGMRRMICGDTGTKCNAVFEGQNDDKIVLKAVEHLAQYHDFPLSVDLATRVRGLIKTV